MCDTVVALPDVTRDGVTLFAKNSDREPNEAQLVERHPAREPDDGWLDCTEKTIPAVGQTAELVISRPTWMWGAEMGANEHGLAVGNEAVFTREPYADTGLLGMDFVRLVLERAESAAAGVDCLATLLEAHGQGGNHAPFGEFRYHNSFLLADPTEAWIVETAGEWWAAERVTEGVATVSNGLTIAEPDRHRDGLIEHAIAAGYGSDPGDFDFASWYGDPLRTRVSRCRRRQSRTRSILDDRAGALTTPDLMAVLRDHGETSPTVSGRVRSAVGATGPAASLGNVCMHAGGLLADQTTGSQVSRLGGDHRHWFTGTAAPCTSLFRPFPLGCGSLPNLGAPETGRADGDSLWWRHERLHRAVLRNYEPRLATYRGERDRLETAFLERAANATDASARRSLATDCAERADAALSRWTEAVGTVPAREWTRPLFAWRWRRQNRKAGLTVG